ncbi:MAG: hypothetical protein U1F43_31785 [Myxococcota bacterium]
MACPTPTFVAPACPVLPRCAWPGRWRAGPASFARTTSSTSAPVPASRCVAAALACRSRFIGIEQRLHLVDAARELARAHGVEARDLHRRAALARDHPARRRLLPLQPARGELRASGLTTTSTTLDPESHDRDVAEVEALFAEARPGTVVMLYNGFGGRLPPSYERLRVDEQDPLRPLELWKKSG